ncbi:general L-amino acid transport system permease protein [Rubricella aquisinus]|uniref:General L-amino acid transport system permease protein n=1 Tax=Rubricella aquisinus TaxID=2028108 RepID=A0A840X120_9RHOB|nr:amino acid ABC transporter permease [Rubricella aquisinus]MBB5517070.1 general L-amino acid transport system permease protein [Rubricella aquisinus]
MSDTHSHSAAFVRHDQIPPSPPPAGETGPVKWIRENLASSVSNAIMTVIGLVAIFYLAIWALPWFTNSVWNAADIRECREIMGDARGACFAVIEERWLQLLFGFYPPESYWRLIISFFGLFLALAPILFSNLPRVLMVWTGLFPFVSVWLIWGGSFWGPAMVLAGFVVGYFIFRFASTINFVAGLAAGIVGAIIWWSFLLGPIAGVLSSIIPIELAKVESREIGGFTINFILGISSISLSLPLGILLALGRQSNLFFIKGVCVVFIEFIRGVPLITLLFVANVILAFFLPPGSNFDLMLRVIIMITLFASAYIAEVIRGGLAALPTGQYEAADALGLDYWQAIRFIILPQALKISIPGIVNIFIGLFKDTTLVSVISMFDLVGMIRGPILSSTDWSGIYWELWFFASALFFVFCYGISKYSMYLEDKLRTDHR